MVFLAGPCISCRYPPPRRLTYSPRLRKLAGSSCNYYPQFIPGNCHFVPGSKHSAWRIPHLCDKHATASLDEVESILSLQRLATRQTQFRPNASHANSKIMRHVFNPDCRPFSGRRKETSRACRSFVSIAARTCSAQRPMGKTTVSPVSPATSSSTSLAAAPSMKADPNWKPIFRRWPLLSGRSFGACGIHSPSPGRSDDKCEERAGRPLPLLRQTGATRQYRVTGHR